MWRVTTVLTLALGALLCSSLMERAFAQSGSAFDAGITIQDQLNFTGFDQINCDPQRRRYTYSVSNFFTQQSNDFRAELECNGDSQRRSEIFSVPGRTNSLNSLGPLYLSAPSGSVANRLCRAYLYVRNPQPLTLTDEGDWIEVDESGPLMCGDVVINNDRTNAIKTALDDDDDNPFDIQAAAQDGRLWENPTLFFILESVLLGVLAVAVGGSVVSNYNEQSDHTKLSVDKTSATSRSQVTDTLSGNRTEDIPEGESYLGRGGGGGGGGRTDLSAVPTAYSGASMHKALADEAVHLGRSLKKAHSGGGGRELSEEMTEDDHDYSVLLYH